jgi:heme iron utilization protein
MASPYLQQARDLVAESRVGFLATQMKKSPGYPYCSMAPYAADAVGRPVFLLSGLAAHTKNLAAEPRASLLVSGPSVFADPRNTQRLSLMGTVDLVPDEEIVAAQALYLAAWPDAEPLLELADFQFFRMTVEDLHYVGGFGLAGWISPSDYTACPASSK